MAQVVQCDVCGNTCKTHESMNAVIWSMSGDYTRNKTLADIDLCPVCFKKLKEVLKIDK